MGLLQNPHAHRSTGPGYRPPRRLSWHNARGLARWLVFKLRHPGLDTGLFFMHKNVRMDIGRDAVLIFGRGVQFREGFEGRLYGRIELADGVYFQTGCIVSVHKGLTVGRNSGFAEYVSLHDNDHIGGTDDLPGSGFHETPIVIGEGVWVGAKSTILRGVHIGDGAIVGAHSLVTKDVPPRTVVAGAPARVVREL
jgi:acetyltransferase-like isoleucine patch superfamily enzyme